MYQDLRTLPHPISPALNQLLITLPGPQHNLRYAEVPSINTNLQSVGFVLPFIGHTLDLNASPNPKVDAKENWLQISPAIVIIGWKSQKSAEICGMGSSKTDLQSLSLNCSRTAHRNSLAIYWGSIGHVQPTLAHVAKKKLKPNNLLMKQLLEVNN